VRADLPAGVVGGCQQGRFFGILYELQQQRLCHRCTIPASVLLHNSANIALAARTVDVEQRRIVDKVARVCLLWVMTNFFADTLFL
jgi:hypothetical protein